MLKGDTGASQLPDLSRQQRRARGGAEIDQSLGLEEGERGNGSGAHGRVAEPMLESLPIEGLAVLLAGQDALCPGIAGAMWGGMLCAAAIDPRVFRKLG